MAFYSCFIFISGDFEGYYHVLILVGAANPWIISQWWFVRLLGKTRWWVNQEFWFIHWHRIIEESSTRMPGLQSRTMSGLILMQWTVHDQAPHHKFRLLMHRKVRACKMWNKISAQDILGGAELQWSESGHQMMPAGWRVVTGGQCTLQIHCSQCSQAAHNNKIRTHDYGEARQTKILIDTEVSLLRIYNQMVNRGK